MAILSGFQKQKRYMRINNDGDDKLISEWTSTDTVEFPNNMTNYEHTLDETTDWNDEYDDESVQPKAQADKTATNMFIKLTCAFNNIKWLKKQADSADQSINTLNTQVTRILDMIYPVGSLYWSSNNVNPSTLFGGTWVQIKDKFILAAGDTYDVNTSGGAATHSVTFTGTTDEHALTLEEMPRHLHGFSNGVEGTTDVQGEHYHSSAYPIPQVAYGVSDETYPIEVMMTDEEAGRDTSLAGSHQHNVTIDEHQFTDEAGGWGEGSTWHEVRPHSHTLSATAGGSVDTMPPYEVFYCWKRIQDPQQ